MLNKNLYLVRKKELNQAASTLASAFIDDPVYEHYFPDIKIRQRTVYQTNMFFLKLGFLNGTVFSTSPLLEGISVWIESKNIDFSIFQLIKAGVIKNALISMRLYLYMNRYSKVIHNQKLSFAPTEFMYLMFLGVHKNYQGQGVCSRLLRPVLSHLDKTKTPCYLETVTESNIQIYSRFGFNLANSTKIPKSNFTAYAMIRNPL